MPLPGNIGFGTVTGTYIDFHTGNPLSGSVSFTPTPTRLTDVAAARVILPAPRIVSLDVNGSFAVTMPATNDVDMQPVNFTYTVSENITTAGHSGATFSIALAQGQTVDLSQALAVTADAGTITYVGGGGPGPGGAVSSVAGRTGAIILSGPDITAGTITDTQISAGAAIQTSKISGLGTAAALNVPVSGNAATNQVVKGDDSRLTGSGSGGGLTSFNTRTGPAITLTAGDVTGVVSLGNAAPLNVGTTSGTVAAGDDSRFTGLGSGTSGLIMPGVPVSGCIWGAFVNKTPSTMSSITTTGDQLLVDTTKFLEGELGRTLGGHRIYISPGSSGNTIAQNFDAGRVSRQMSNDATNSRTSYLSYKTPFGQTWGTMAGQTTVFINEAKKLNVLAAANKAGIVVMFHHEPDVSPAASGGATTVQQQRAEYKLCVSNFFLQIRQYAPTVTTAICVGGYKLRNATWTAQDYIEYMPDDRTLVDMWAVDPYNNAANSSATFDADPASFLDPWNTFCSNGSSTTTINKYMGIFEAGVTFASGARPAWTNLVYAWVKNHTNCKTLLFFSGGGGVGDGGTVHDTYIDDDSAIAFTHASTTNANNNYFKPNLGSSSGPTVTSNDAFDVPSLRTLDPTPGGAAPYFLGMQAVGDLVANTGLGPARVPIGTNGQVLTVFGGAPVWAAPPSGGGGGGNYLDPIIVAANGSSAGWQANAVASGGAVCDNIDDNVQINAALTTAAISSRPVQLSPGTFTINTTSVGGFWMGIVMATRNILRGCGEQFTTIRLKDGAHGTTTAITRSNHVLSNANPGTTGAQDSNITIEDLTFDGNQANNTPSSNSNGLWHGVKFWNVDGFRVRRVTVINCGGFDAGNNETFHFDGQSCNDGYWEDCFCATTFGAATSTGFASNNSTNMHWTRCVGEGMQNGHNFSAYRCRNLTVTDCAMRLGANMGFNFEHCEQVGVANCVSGGRAATAAGKVFTASQSLANGDIGFSVLGDDGGTPFPESNHVSFTNCHNRGGTRGFFIHNAYYTTVTNCSSTETSSFAYEEQGDSTAIQLKSLKTNKVENFTTDGTMAVWPNNIGGVGAIFAHHGVQTAPTAPGAGVAMYNPFPWAMMVYLPSAMAVTITDTTPTAMGLGTISQVLLPRGCQITCGASPAGWHWVDA